MFASGNGWEVAEFCGCYCFISRRNPNIELQVEKLKEHNATFTNIVKY